MKGYIILTFLGLLGGGAKSQLINKRHVMLGEEDYGSFAFEKLNEDNAKNWEKLRLLTLNACRVYDERGSRRNAMMDYFKKRLPVEMPAMKMNEQLDQYFSYLRYSMNDFRFEPSAGTQHNYVIYFTTDNVIRSLRFPDFFDNLPSPSDQESNDSPSSYLAFLNNLDDEKLDQLNDLLAVTGVSYDEQIKGRYTLQETFYTLNGFVEGNQRREYQQLSIPMAAFGASIVPTQHPEVEIVAVPTLNSHSPTLYSVKDMERGFTLTHALEVQSERVVSSSGIQEEEEPLNDDPLHSLNLGIDRSGPAGTKGSDLEQPEQPEVPV